MNISYYVNAKDERKNFLLHADNYLVNYLAAVQATIFLDLPNLLAIDKDAMLAKLKTPSLHNDASTR